MADLIEPTTTPWRTVTQAAARAQVSEKTIYLAVAAGRLRAARVSGRRAIRLRDEWIDAYLESTATPIEVPEMTVVRRRA